jgi:hypothetical protein
MRSFRAVPWVVAGLVALAVGTAVGVALRKPPEGLPVTDPRVTFVGTKACDPCHHRLVAEFLETNHYRSFLPARPENLGGGIAKTGLRIAIHQPEFGYALRPEGEKVLFVAAPPYAGQAEAPGLRTDVKYVLGSGTRGQSLITPLRSRGESLLALLPVSYLADRGGWGISPGYDEFIHQNPLRMRWAKDECLHCHTVVRPDEGDGQGLAADQVEGVGCEACHGPGSSHVARWAGSVREVTKVHPDRTILNPARLGADRAEEICSTCHSMELDPLPGKSFAYRPGLPLETAFRKRKSTLGEHHSESESLRASRCFQESGGAIRCSTCHTPHSRPNPAMYVRACEACHQPQSCPKVVAGADLKVNDCIKCHMPMTQPWSHASYRDHRILRIPPPPEKKPADAPFLM